MLFRYTIGAAFIGQALAASPSPEWTRSSCPDIHVFGARNTDAPKGYGLAKGFVDDILKAFSGSTAEAIRYPADGRASNGDPTYAASIQAGVGNLTDQVTTFAQRCPNTRLVLVGYSQGAHIIDDALCGGGDPNQGIYDDFPTIAQFNIQAVLLPGDDRFVPGEPFHVGTAKKGGFDARPESQVNCGFFDDAIQLYCDENDEFCASGNSLQIHNGYYHEYGQAALEFVKSRLRQ